MNIVWIVLSVLVALGFVMAGVAKLRRAEPVTGTLERLGVSAGLQRTIGALEILGGLGVAIGIWWQPLGIAAAIGLVLLMIGAVGYHVKEKDKVGETAGAIVLLVLSALVAVVPAIA